jgi:hypothetical protein
MLLSEICDIVSVGRPLWGEDGSAICSVITQWSESRRTRNHTSLSYLRLSHPGGPGSPIYIPQEQSGPVIHPGIGFSLRRLLRFAGLRCRYSNPPPTWWARFLQQQDGPVQSQSEKSKSRYDRRSVTQYVLVPSPLCFRGAPSERISIRHQEGYIKVKFFMLPFGVLHVKHAVQRGIWVPTQHLLCLLFRWGHKKETPFPIILRLCFTIHMCILNCCLAAGLYDHILTYNWGIRNMLRFCRNIISV